MKAKFEPIKRVGLIANLTKSSSRQAVRHAAGLILQTGREVACDIGTDQLAGLEGETFETPAALAQAVDLLLVFGGDGTILQVVREMRGARAPILGINVGRLGFLTAVPFSDLHEALQKIWRNDFVIESRFLVEARGQCQGVPFVTHALNDVVISHGTVSRLIELEVCVNDEPLTCYRGDGLIVCSPTGSTAYSLSAGGPIISPDADVLAITPICPHTLSNRSVVISSKSTVQVKLVSAKLETIVSADGQVQTPLSMGEVVTISRSRRTVRLLHPGGMSFFETVRRKLHWRGSYV